MNLTRNESLQHHGVKGQKWGVRKDQEPGNGSTRTTQEVVNKKTVSQEQEDSKTTGSNLTKKGKKVYKALAVGGLMVAGILAAVAITKKAEANKLKQQRSAAAKKAAATRLYNKQNGTYVTYKNVNVLVGQGQTLSHAYQNIKMARLRVK